MRCILKRSTAFWPTKSERGGCNLIPQLSRVRLSKRRQQKWILLARLCKIVRAQSRVIPCRSSPTGRLTQTTMAVFYRACGMSGWRLTMVAFMSICLKPLWRKLQGCPRKRARRPSFAAKAWPLSMTARYIRVITSYIQNINLAQSNKHIWAI